RRETGEGGLAGQSPVAVATGKCCVGPSGLEKAGNFLNLHGRDARATKEDEGAIDGDVACATIHGGLRAGVLRAKLTGKALPGV
ncbi:MAG: hypothetical protein ACK43N_07165, partial [Pirellulaceae bacterium]